MTKEDGRLGLAADRATDAPHGAPDGSPPSGSVSTDAGAGYATEAYKACLYGRADGNQQRAVASALILANADKGRLLEALEGAVHFSDAVAYRDDTLSTALRQWLQAGADAIAKARGQ